MKPLIFTTMLALSACATLTGDPKADCLAARNTTLQAQGGVAIAEAYATSHPGKDADQAVVFARAYLATAVANEAAACAQP